MLTIAREERNVLNIRLSCIRNTISLTLFNCHVQVNVVYTDFSEAFDRVNRASLFRYFDTCRAMENVFFHRFALSYPIGKTEQ